MIALVGLGAAGLLWRSDRLRGVAIGALLAACAAIFGAVAFRSVPVETQPTSLLWLLPTIAVVALAVVALVRNRLATTVYLDGLTTIAGVALAAWGLDRFDALHRALIPSDAPAGPDRVLITAALIVGAAIAVKGIAGLLRPRRLIEVSS